MMITKDKHTDLWLYRRLLWQARPYWLHIVGILVLSLLSTPLALLTPLPLKIAVDSVLGSHPIPEFLNLLVPATFTRSDTGILILTVALLILVAFVLHLRGLANSALETYTGQKLVLQFRSQLFHHVQRLSLIYHDTRGATDSTFRILYDAPAIQWIAVHGVIPFITAGFTLIGMIYITAQIDLQLALIALTVAPLLFLFTRVFRTYIRGEWSKVKQLESFTMGVVQESLAAIRVVRAFGQEDHEKKRFLRHAHDNVRGQIRLALMNGGYELLIALTIAIGTGIALFIGVRHVQAGDLTLGNLLLVMAYLALLYSPLQTINKKMTDLQASFASAERAFALLDLVPDVAEKHDAQPLSQAIGAITFSQVSFAYSIGRPVLHDISFDIAPGTRVGLVGPTGAGKTTLISLLTRFYDPTVGRILLDGTDLRDYRLADLRNQFAIVLQEPVLFSASIAENIAYARQGASEEEIIEAARAANAHDFISNLPKGYETTVGAGGMTLSGGERQRIALARAFLKDAHILILDEPTSSVDVKTESLIVEAMEHLMKGRTTFIIAHRLSTLRSCDVQFVIENGRLVSQTPTEHSPFGNGRGVGDSPSTVSLTPSDSERHF